MRLLIQMTCQYKLVQQAENTYIRGIVNTVLVTPNYSQQDATFLDLFIPTDILYVSGGSSAHHQEHITVHTASDIVNQYC